MASVQAEPCGVDAEGGNESTIKNSKKIIGGKTAY